MKNQKEKTVTIKIELDTTDVQKKLDEINDRLRNYDGFKIDHSGQVFINDAFIDGIIHAAEPEGTQSVTNTYNISLGIRRDDTVHFAGIGVDTNLEALIENAVKNHVQSAVRDIKKQLAADRMTLKDLTSHIKNVMLLESFPGGILHRNFGRR